MHNFIRNIATVGFSVLALAVTSGVPAMASQAAPAHAAVAADTPDGYPDPGPAIEPDITPRPLCKVNDALLCARDTNNSDSAGSVMFSGNQTPGPAEDTKFVGNGGTFTFRTHTYHTGLLHLTGHSGLCYSGDLGAVTTANCATGTATVWGHGMSAGHDVWVNRAETQRLNDLRVLASTNTFGVSLSTVSWFNTSFYKKWSF
jgi:hypothetical protein